MKENTVKAVIECAKKLEWSVQTSTPNESDIIIFEFYKFSLAGRDFGFAQA